MEIQRVDKQRSERRFSNAKLQLMHIMDSVDDILQELLDICMLPGKDSKKTTKASKSKKIETHMSDTQNLIADINGSIIQRNKHHYKRTDTQTFLPKKVEELLNIPVQPAILPPPQSMNDSRLCEDLIGQVNDSSDEYEPLSNDSQSSTQPIVETFQSEVTPPQIIDNADTKTSRTNAKCPWKPPRSMKRVETKTDKRQFWRPFFDT